ncbi:MAG TPA: hypothetical protein PKA41_18935 [Verrucomicrobiota bacterium]|nr:hypothetical protein [Verrucomicrobiota bacterium]
MALSSTACLCLIGPLADDDLRAKAAFSVLAPFQAGELAQLVPQIKAPDHGLDGHNPGVDGMTGIDDKPEIESGFFLGDGNHAFQTKRTEINSPPSAFFYLADKD